MSNVGYDTWEPRQCSTVFIVKNISGNKRIKLFTVPIGIDKERDLMGITWVSEADIRHSLLKGELLTKFKAKEIEVVFSNIDLLQFDDCQKEFLESIGITEGLEVVGGGGDIPFAFKQQVELIGVKDKSNRVFTVPDIFINGTFGANSFHILIRHNGRDLVEGTDYLLVESGGSGTGFDTIVLTSFAPKPRSVLVADYVVEI